MKKTIAENAAMAGEYHEASQQERHIVRTLNGAAAMAVAGILSATAIATVELPKDDTPMAPLPKTLLNGSIGLGLLGTGAVLGAGATRRREQKTVRKSLSEAGITVNSPDLNVTGRAKNKYILPDGRVLVPGAKVNGWTEISTGWDEPQR